MGVQVPTEAVAHVSVGGHGSHIEGARFPGTVVKSDGELPKSGFGDSNSCPLGPLSHLFSPRINVSIVIQVLLIYFATTI